jgi:hypothetical protein
VSDSVGCLLEDFVAVIDFVPMCDPGEIRA